MTRGNDKSVAPILANVQEILEAHRKIFRQERVFWRSVALFFGELFNFGRHTVTQGLLTLGLYDADWSAWYRLFSKGRFDAKKAGQEMLRQTLEHVAKEAPYVIVGDGVKVYRHSQKMPGTHWTKGSRTAPFQPGLERAQRFVDISLVTADRGRRMDPGNPSSLGTGVSRECGPGPDRSEKGMGSGGGGDSVGARAVR